ncbi:MAG: S-adenosylmethionine:tRNA ribosyltransferase-isomerase, partial [Pseudonocardiaceae bacterium]
LSNVTCLCPWKPAIGSAVAIKGGRFMVDAMPEPGRDLRTGRIVTHDPNVTDLQTFMKRFGEVPIPIYVNAQRNPDAADVTDYQNVYASVSGSVACPTAGLHFTEELLGALRERGHQIAEVTLHVGYGTWKSLAAEYVDQHTMDAEYCELTAETLRLVRAAKQDGRPVVAVGTSSVRTLESYADNILTDGPINTLRRKTTLYVAPPFDFRVVDHLITNFAYPQTPIMALTTAFVGSRELLFDAYQSAVDHPEYLFFSYGDGMFIR